MAILRPRELVGLAKRAVKGWIEDSAPSMGASLAFYTLFSLAPLLLLAVAVAGIFFGRNEAQNFLIAHLTQVIGDKAALGIEQLLDAAGMREERTLPAIIGTATLLLGASTVLAELRADLDRVWHCRAQRSKGVWDFVRTRLFLFGIVLAFGFLLVVSLVASAVLAAIGSALAATTETPLHGAEFMVSFIMITGLFAMIYKLMPSTPIAWDDVWVGAAVTSLLFWLGKFLIALYIAKTAYDSKFGAAGTLVVIVMWVYYSAQIFFLGAEFTREYALQHGSRRNDPDGKGRPAAANEEHIVDRAEKIVKGDDPVLLGRKP